MLRRQFIAGALNAGLTSMMARQTGAGISLPMFSIPGADPTGIKDSTEAFQEATSKLPKKNARLFIPAGRYRFEPCATSIFTFRDIDELEINGSGALFLFAGDTPAFHFEGCRGVVVSGITMDWVRPMFSQGIVQHIAPGKMTLRIDPEFPVTGNEPVDYIGEYDRNLRLPSRNGAESYYQTRSVSLAASQTLVVETNRAIHLRQGTTVVLRHPTYGKSAFTLMRCRKVRFEDVTLHASPGMGILAYLGADFEFHRLRVLPTPGTNRLLSLNADAVHLQDCAGSITFSSCEFSGMGDDAINIHANYYKIARSTGSRSSMRWTLDSRYPILLKADHLPGPDTVLEIVHPATQVLAGHARVLPRPRQLQDGRIEVEILGFDDTAQLEGLVVCNSLKGAATEVHDCNFCGNRARAIVAHSEARIYRNRFYGQSLAAILVSADSSYWLEGPVVRDVEIFSNHFEFNYYTNREYRRGAVTIDTAEDARGPDPLPARVYKDISIHDNEFVDSCGCGVFAARTAGLSLVRNAFKGSSEMEDGDRRNQAIVLNNVNCSHLEGNHSATAEHLTTLNRCDLPPCRQGGCAASNTNISIRHGE